MANGYTNLALGPYTKKYQNNGEYFTRQNLNVVYGSMPYNVFATDWRGNLLYLNQHAQNSLLLTADKLQYEQRPNASYSKLPGILRELVHEAVVTGKEVTNRQVAYVEEIKNFISLGDAIQRGQEYQVYDCHMYFLCEHELQKTLYAPSILIMLMPNESVDITSAEDANIVGQLAAGLANKIRNPLTTVKGFMQLIYEQKEPNKMNKAYLSTALDELETANDHLRDFILCLQPSTPEVREYQAQQLLWEALSQLSCQAEEKNVTVTLEQATPGVVVKGDREQLVKALRHILTNGIEYAPAGGSVTATMDYSRLEHRAKIIIRDDGPGINSRASNHIFEPYYTTSATKVGLGLAIAKALLENNGGSVVCLSKPQEGAEFIITLPVAAKQTAFKMSNEKMPYDGNLW